MSDDTLTTGLRPIIKWPGGKEKELKYIIPNLPVFNRYFEPFVGGGAVFTGIQAEEYFINDLSSELIELYTSIAFIMRKDEKISDIIQEFINRF